MNPSERIDDKELQEALLVTMLLFSGGKYNPSAMVLDSGKYVASLKPYEKDEIPNTLNSIERIEEKGIIEEMPDGWQSGEFEGPVVRAAWIS